MFLKINSTSSKISHKYIVTYRDIFSMASTGDTEISAFGAANAFYRNCKIIDGKNYNRNYRLIEKIEIPKK